MVEITADVLWGAFIMTILAALSTFTGAMTSLYFKKVNPRTLSVILGFAAGIMLYTAFVKFLPDSIAILTSTITYKDAKIASTLFFFFGVLLLYPLGQLIHLKKVPHNMGQEELHYRHLATLLLIAIMAHSFVEGVATFLSFLTTPLVAVPLMLSIIVHNFPEGMTIGALFKKVNASVRLRRALWYCILASLVEPFGALMAYFFLMKYSTPVMTGIIKSFLAGLLVATALNELIPNSQLKGTRRVSVQSIIAGMFVMGMVLLSGVVW